MLRGCTPKIIDRAEFRFRPVTVALEVPLPDPGIRSRRFAKLAGLELAGADVNLDLHLNTSFLRLFITRKIERANTTGANSTSSAALETDAAVSLTVVRIVNFLS